MTILEKSAYLSLVLQFITGAIDIWGLNLKIPESLNIFRQLLWIELVVQVIELIFYVWMVIQFLKKKKFKNITVYRYFDWFVTTPSMLLTLMVFLDYNPGTSPPSVLEFIKQNAGIVVTVWILNWIMLGFGLVGELGWMDTKKSAILGFIPFALYFLLIYKYFIYDKPKSDNPKGFQANEQRNVFIYFLVVWSLYGVAALLSYEARNTMYNILDLFAKNFFGLFLVYILYTKSIQ
jgi:bacteriorhodopsin